MDVSGDLLLISQAINDPQKNPYLIKSWDAEDLGRRLSNLSDAVASIWIQCITHLQTYAWRVHDKDCINRECFGGCGHDVARLFFHRSRRSLLLGTAMKPGWLPGTVGVRPMLWYLGRFVRRMGIILLQTSFIRPRRISGLWDWIFLWSEIF